MTSGVYPRTEKHRINIANALRGRKYQGTIVGWKGENVGYKRLHFWVRKNLSKPDLCLLCNKIPPYDVANISGKYHRSLDDWQWICRRCHMLNDGRLQLLVMYNKLRHNEVFRNK
jgi:hypothetical protein